MDIFWVCVSVHVSVPLLKELHIFRSLFSSIGLTHFAQISGSTLSKRHAYQSYVIYHMRQKQFSQVKTLWVHLFLLTEPFQLVKFWWNKTYLFFCSHCFTMHVKTIIFSSVCVLNCCTIISVLALLFIFHFIYLFFRFLFYFCFWYLHIAFALPSTRWAREKYRFLRRKFWKTT